MYICSEESHDCPEGEDLLLLLLEPDPILAEEDFPLSSNRRSLYHNWDFQIPQPLKIVK